jgi:hypothetical protein
VFVAVAAGRCPFRVADLLALARLAEGLSGGVPETCVRQIMPLMSGRLCRVETPGPEAGVRSR